MQASDPRQRSIEARRRGISRIGFLVVVAALIAGGVVEFLGGVKAPAPGPFYVQPAPLPTGPPGTVVRAEPLAGAPEGARAWKILYLSRSYTGKRTAMSGLLFVPSTPPPGAGRDVVAFTHGTVGVAPACAVSNGKEFWPHIDGLAQFLRAGDDVVVPDYQGLGTAGPHPYLVGDAEATATLDAVRAAHLFAAADGGTRFVVWGPSQGGHAALFTGQQARSYAPGLHLEGVAAAAPATELEELFKVNRDGTFGRILSAYTLDMWSQVYPELHLDQVVSPLARPVVRTLSRICISADNGPIAAAAISLALKLTYLHKLPWDLEPWKGLLELNTPGAAKIPAPILITQGAADRLVRPAVTAAFAKHLCGQGATVDYRSYPGVDHIRAGPDTVSAVARWIAERFAGAKAPSTCAAGR
ncbi:MAG TPA: alpha/beta fold hydrolase [Solirubrobacteraceae bacterium]|nr:alpha/beta fold hydrolase [Solirubrobacteraceae bacterium]